MPYILPEQRGLLSIPCTAGGLNYKITMLLIAYTKEKGLSYQTINDIMGACEGAKQEYYRRVATPYEESKIKINSDVYPKSLVGEQNG